MTLRLLLALVLAASSAGSGAVRALDDQGRSEDAVVATAADASDSADPGLVVEKAELVVRTTDDAAAVTEQALADAHEDVTDGATTVPTEVPTEAPTEAPTEVSGPDATPQETVTAVDPDAAPTAGAVVDPAAGAVVAGVLADDRVLTAPVDTDGTQTIGVTWPQDAGATSLDPQVRTFSEGEWSDWATMDYSDDAPDAGTADAGSTTRGGTDSFWIGDVEAVQLSFAATDTPAPADMDLTLVGSDEVEADLTTAQGSVATGGAVVLGALATSSATVLAAASQPTVISRSQWGARAQVCRPDVASSLVGAVVHHTAGSNSYSTVAVAMQQIRNDQAYHIDGRGWCDIGYNFIVDKWGNIYEGRANSLTQAVIGVHAGGFNTGTVGVAMLGTYSSAPSAATQQAVGAIIGWRLASYGVDPQGWMSYATGEGENSRYTNTTVPLPTVFGHRDVSYTACPGDGGYAVLQAIRTVAAQSRPVMPTALAASVVRALYQDLFGRLPDASGLATWTARLQSGTTVAALSTRLMSSTEYATVRVTQAYRDVFGREPDQSGLTAWVARVLSGSVAVDEVATHFMTRPEFLSVAGGTDAGLVDRLFSVVLDRGPSTAERSTWVARVATMGQEGVIRYVVASKESSEVQVTAYYRQFFSRAVDASGLATWSAVLRSPGAPTVRVRLLSSAEYLSRAPSRASA